MYTTQLLEQFQAALRIAAQDRTATYDSGILTVSSNMRAKIVHQPRHLTDNAYSVPFTPDEFVRAEGMGYYSNPEGLHAHALPSGGASIAVLADSTVMVQNEGGYHLNEGWVVVLWWRVA